ncbi:oplophorus-luciferin 2-monooxygenase non-catalytic subunit-like [Homarus americanus]|uniref:Oplophorus-luciferin 2-monooxygenase non-catalytic subunit-like 9 n=1 Tax=Homarus americanus TaxID=6706 RepID=A0A8J5JK73_HOMAM|nr:oplophorus-luciferin 2-monooxygenase non-catalytic subunit-like [Homarus americanus]KAG7157571.1 Oplophorus-luciferin 2-monooxygenase non-catalytic subunit-like 9 [Homarus americanus]
MCARLLLTLFLAVSCHGNKLSLHDRVATEVACPNAEDISPCTCMLYDNEYIDVDCSLVKDEEELRHVFEASFPTTAIRTFFMYHNQNVQQLRNGVFGDATFVNLVMENNALEMVEEEVFTKSLDVSIHSSFKRNKLSDIPLDTLPLYTSLEYIDLSENLLAGSPALSSPTIRHLDLHGNALGDLPVDTLIGIPKLTHFFASNLELTDIHPGLFEGLVDLQEVSLHHNNVWMIEADTFSTSGHNLQYVDLHHNSITTVAANAFPDMDKGSSVDLGSNNITLVEEGVWRPLLEGHVRVFLQGNPLECGCDLAWVVRNSTLLEQLPHAYCNDGTPLDFLKPEDFDQC